MNISKIDGDAGTRGIGRGEGGGRAGGGGGGGMQRLWNGKLQETEDFIKEQISANEEAVKGGKDGGKKEGSGGKEGEEGKREGRKEKERRKEGKRGR